MSDSYSIEVEYKLLQIISMHEAPVGAGFLADMLQKEKNFTLSETTIGRYLRRLEQQGFLESKKYDGRSRGRTITEKGLERVRAISAGRTQARAIANVMEMLHNGSDAQLRNVLVTRAIIEPEVAALAAQHATAENLAAIQNILDEMTQLTNEGRAMAATDSPFHIEIARASGNPVLESVIQMIRTDYDYSPEIECIINTSSQTSPGDHWSIFQAIRERNPDQARQIMKQHIQNIIEKLDAYETEKLGV